MSTTPKPKHIERKMAKTRSRIDQTLEKIEERVSPSAVQTAAQEGMRHARKMLEQEADRKLDSATSQVSRAGTMARDFIQRHPLIIAAVGVGVGLMLRSKQSETPELPVITTDTDKEIL